MKRAAQLWDDVFFAEASATTLRATRAVVCLHALWMLLSRPDIPELMSWPDAFLAVRPRAELIRFGIGVLPEGVEWALFRVLHVALLTCLFGVMPRISAAVAGLLLYHFAPFEEIIVGMPHSFFGGLTLPTLALLVLAFARRPGEAGPVSSEYRWPIAVIQLLFAFNYFFAGIAKLRFGHLSWFTGVNIRNWIIENWALTLPPWSLVVAESPTLCWMIAIATFALELSFPIVVCSKLARRIYPPAAAIGHLGIVKTLGIAFPSAPLLLLYVNWDWLLGHGRRLIRAAAPPKRADAGAR